jgi:hypothetical protein
LSSSFRVQTPFDRRLNVLIFGGFALAAASRLVTPGPSAGGIGHAVGLLVLSSLCYAYGSGGQLRRITAILIYLVGWLGSPAWGLWCLFGLWFLGVWRGAAARLRREPEEKNRVPCAESTQARGELESEGEVNDSGGMARMLLTMKVASEAEGKIRAFHAPFASTYGDGVVPLLMVTESGERGIYIESGPWTSMKEEACLRWLAALRTSD